MPASCSALQPQKPKKATGYYGRQRNTANKSPPGRGVANTTPKPRMTRRGVANTTPKPRMTRRGVANTTPKPRMTRRTGKSKPSDEEGGENKDSELYMAEMLETFGGTQAQLMGHDDVSTEPVNDKHRIAWESADEALSGWETKDAETNNGWYVKYIQDVATGEKPDGEPEDKAHLEEGILKMARALVMRDPAVGVAFKIPTNLREDHEEAVRLAVEDMIPTLLDHKALVRKEDTEFLMDTCKKAVRKTLNGTSKPDRQAVGQSSRGRTIYQAKDDKRDFIAAYHKANGTNQHRVANSFARCATAARK